MRNIRIALALAFIFAFVSPGAAAQQKRNAAGKT